MATSLQDFLTVIKN